MNMKPIEHKMCDIRMKMGSIANKNTNFDVNIKVCNLQFPWMTNRISLKILDNLSEEIIYD